MFRRWGLGVFARTKWNYDGDRGETPVPMFGSATFMNYIESRFNLFYSPRSLTEDLTRGGPMMQVPRFLGINLNLNSNYASPNSWRLSTEFSKNEIGGSFTGIFAGVGYRPSSKLGLSLDPQWFRLLDKRQYVTTLDGGLPATYDRRYVFATADQTVLAATIRLNYTFNPDVTLELFAQPFTASGDYYGYSEQAEPRVLALREYGTDGTTITAESDQHYRGGRQPHRLFVPDRQSELQQFFVPEQRGVAVGMAAGEHALLRAAAESRGDLQSLHRRRHLSDRLGPGLGPRAWARSPMCSEFQATISSR